MKLFIFVDEKDEEVPKVEDDTLLTSENIENLNFKLLVGIIVLSVFLLDIIIIFCFISNLRYLFTRFYPNGIVQGRCIVPPFFSDVYFSMNKYIRYMASDSI